MCSCADMRRRSSEAEARQADMRRRSSEAEVRQADMRRRVVRQRPDTQT